MKAEETQTKSIKKAALIILETNSVEETIDWVIAKMEVNFESQLKEKEFGDYLINALPTSLVDQYRKDFLTSKTK